MKAEINSSNFKTTIWNYEIKRENSQSISADSEIISKIIDQLYIFRSEIEEEGRVF